MDLVTFDVLLIVFFNNVVVLFQIYHFCGLRPPVRCLFDVPNHLGFIFLYTIFKVKIVYNYNIR